MMGYGWGMGPWGWIFMGLFWLVMLGLVVWSLAALLPRPGRRVPAGPSRPESPEEILDRRFARGEIDLEQYRAARSELAAGRR